MTGADQTKGNARDSGYEEDPLSWYVETAECVDQLLDVEDFSGCLVCDPACGQGTILDRAAARGYPVFGSDVVDRGAGARHEFRTIDFLREPICLPDPCAIICNPPYGRLEDGMPRGDSYAERFIRRALHLGARQVAMIVQAKFLFSERRYHLFQEDHPPTQLMFCSERPSMPPGAQLPRLIAEGKAHQGGSLDFFWAYWKRGAPARPPIWLKPSSIAAAHAAEARQGAFL